MKMSSDPEAAVGPRSLAEVVLCLTEACRRALILRLEHRVKRDRSVWPELKLHLNRSDERAEQVCKMHGLIEVLESERQASQAYSEATKDDSPDRFDALCKIQRQIQRDLEGLYDRHSGSWIVELRQTIRFREQLVKHGVDVKKLQSILFRAPYKCRTKDISFLEQAEALLLAPPIDGERPVNLGSTTFRSTVNPFPDRVRREIWYVPGLSEGLKNLAIALQELGGKAASYDLEQKLGQAPSKIKANNKRQIKWWRTWIDDSERGVLILRDPKLSPDDVPKKF